MTFRDFCYWLRGYIELANEDHLTDEQFLEIKRHLDLCFNNEVVYQPFGYPLVEYKDWPQGSC